MCVEVIGWVDNMRHQYCNIKNKHIHLLGVAVEDTAKKKTDVDLC